MHGRGNVRSQFVSVPLALGVLISISGCAPADSGAIAAVCGAFEPSWNSLVATRLSSTDPADVAQVRKNAVEVWAEISRGPGPDDITGMIGTAADHLMNAWNATTTSSRLGYERSLVNASAYVVGRCSAEGFPIELDELPMPLRPGAP